MILNKVLQSAVILLYFGGTLAYFAGLFSRNKPMLKAANWMAVFGFGLHTIFLGHALALQQDWSTLAAGVSIKLLAWCLVLVYFTIWWMKRLDFLALIASPCALLLFISSLQMQGTTVMPKSGTGLFVGFHLGVLFFSIGLMAMAFLAGVLFLNQERKIKSKEKLTGFRQDLPSLATFDLINHWSVLLGFPLYTMGMVSGFVWAKYTWDRVITWDPKEIVTVVIWLLYAMLFHQRIVQGWRGKKPARMAVLIFALTIVSLIGINFFISTHHSFVPQNG